MENAVLNVKGNRLSICLFITAICACVSSVALGLIVLVGWYIHSETLVQIIPAFVPMQYNTALGFLLCGSGMLLAIFKRQYTAAIVGSLPVVIGGLTLFEYSMGMNLGIDELFMKHAITVKTSHPGRMAPNTATCFALIGSALVFHVFLSKQSYIYLLKAIFASLAFGLGIVALSGYMTHLETAYGWGNLTRMAVHTSIGFIVLGVGALALIWRDNLINKKTVLPLWLAVPTGIATMTVTICLWQALQTEYALIARQIDVSVIVGLSRLSYAILISGVLLAIALALAVRYANTSIRRMREIIKVNQSLTGEITEREKAERLLKESEEGYRKLIGTARDAIISIDDNGIVSFWNKSAEKIFGYLEHEIIGQPVTTIIPERYREQHGNGLRRFLETGKVRIMDKTVDVHGITKEGIEVPIEMSLAFQKDKEGNYSFMAIIRDITERKMRDAEIQKLSYAVEQSPVSVVITNTEGDIEYVNKKFTEVTGYSYEEVIGQNPRVLKSDDRTPEEYKDLWETITSGKEWQGEFCNKDKNGTIYWESASISPVKNDAGVITHFIAVKEDITERKQITENLRTLSQAVEQSPSSVMITDTEGIIEYINPKFTELTGYTPEDILGQTPRILKSGKTPLEEYKKLWEAIKSGNEWHGEFCNKKKNGILYWEHTSISPVNNEQGNTTHFVAVNEDVTERRQMEEMLKRSEKVAMVKMKEANESKRKAEVATNAKSEFLANMSHEIRTPMNGIMGMTDLLLDTKLTDEQREFTATVRNSSNALLTIINDILDFSKIEAGKMELENIDFDLHIAVDGTIDILAVKAHQENLELSCFIDPEVPFLLRGDPGKLRQVIINLVNNAMKFTNDGEVAISANLEKETESHATVRFAVRDTGIGIPADRMDRLFKSFSQVDASTTRKYGGTGLGLTICKQIVELMGGQIGVESKEGKGSTFWFTVVLGKQSPEQQPVELGDIENIRVLVVDDNGTNRHIFRKYLESWHCRIEEADSAVEAMKELRDAVDANDPFKVVLLDYCMPEVDGESLCREIKADPQLNDLILVMLTSIGRRGDAEHFKKLEFAAYLTKPLKKSQLLDCLRLVTGELANTGEHTAGQIVTQYSISEDHKRRVNILLAEDNMVNQKIALRILEKKLGYHADAVANGKEVIERLGRKDYDLVLMDCQMPEIDGYEATRIIRDENSSVRNHRITIIAMTANVVDGDKEKCLNAGMDDYITKPIDRQKFTNVIKHYLRNGKEQQLSPFPSLEVRESGTAEQASIPEIIYSEYADDADLVELIDEFAAGLEADVESMRKVLESGDHDGLRRLAHQMKGAGGSYGYPMLTEAAKAIEEAAKAEDVKAGTVALDKLEAFCRSVIRGREIEVKQ